jgi:hypothetical protein
MQATINRLIVILVLALMAVPSIALAQEGPVDPVAPAAICSSTAAGNWSSVSIWDCGHVPTTDDSVAIFNNVTLDVDAAISSLAIKPGHTLSQNDGTNLTLISSMQVSDATFTSHGRVTFAGISAIIGPGTIAFYDVVVVAGHSLTVSPGTSFSVARNWVADGTFTPVSSTVTFNGTTTQTLIGGSTSNVLTFNNIVIANSVGVVIDRSTTVLGDFTINVGAKFITKTRVTPWTLTVTGNWTNNSTQAIGRDNSTVKFIGTNSTIGGTGASDFYDLWIAPGATVHGPIATDLLIAHKFINDGTYDPRTGTIRFNNATTVQGATVTQFNNVRIAAAPGALTALQSFKVRGNWTSGGPFNPGTSTVTFNGPAGGTQTLINSVANPTNFYNLTIGAGTTLNAANYVVNVANVLLVTPGTSAATGGSVRQSAAASGAGPVSFNLAQVTVNVVTPGGMTQLAVVRHQWNHSGAMNSTKTGAWWNIKQTGGSAYSVDLTLPVYTGVPDATWGVCRKDPPGPINWTCYTPVTPAPGTPPTITATGITQLSDWAVGDPSLGGLDVLIDPFEGKLEAGHAVLDWAVVGGSNISGFNIYRSLDGISWTQANTALVQANGGVGGAPYTFTDAQTFVGATVIYGLEVVADTGEKTMASNYVTVVFPGIASELRKLPPHPKPPAVTTAQ